MYTIIRKRQVFHSLANLPSDYGSITKSLNKRTKRHIPNATSHENVAELAMEGSHPALPAEPGTLKATLPDTPMIAQMTERETAHQLISKEQMAVTNGMSSLSLTVNGSEENAGGDNATNSEPEEPKPPTTSSADTSNSNTKSLINTVRGLVSYISNFLTCICSVTA